MNARTIAVGAVVAALAVLLVAWLLMPGTSTAPTSMAPAPARVAAAPGRATSKTFRAGSRTLVPRVGTHAPAPAPTPAPTPEPSGPTDRRLDPGPDAAATRNAITLRMDAARDEIATCIDEWSAVEPDLEGTVNMGFRVDHDGLQEAWIVDHENVPVGPLSCFSDAIYDQDWSNVSKTPIEVTFPFQIDR